MESRKMVLMISSAGQEERHSCREQTADTLEEEGGVCVGRIALIYLYTLRGSVK